VASPFPVDPPILQVIDASTGLVVTQSPDNAMLRLRAYLRCDSGGGRGGG
jgi:hypothetical protein